MNPNIIWQYLYPQNLTLISCWNIKSILETQTNQITYILSFRTSQTSLYFCWLLQKSVLKDALPNKLYLEKGKHYEWTIRSAATNPRPAVTSNDLHTFSLVSSCSGNSTQSCSCNINGQELLYTHYKKQLSELQCQLRGKISLFASLTNFYKLKDNFILHMLCVFSCGEAMV
jgi:hypothetical protein